MFSPVLACCLAAVLAAPAAAISPSFEPPYALDLAGPAATVASGDFDGNGRTDVAAAYPGAVPGAVSVWLGTGNPAGPFVHQATDVAVGAGPQAMVVRDFNRDGREDLAVTNANSDEVSILLGSTGGLVAGETVLVGDGPIGIDAGDFDGDGDADLVVANLGTGLDQRVSVLTGDGSGHFAATDAPVGCHPSGVAVADLVGDGRLDVAVACSNTGFIGIYARAADGHLALVGADHPACDPGYVGVAVGNFDGLGKGDPVVVCDVPSFAVLGSHAGFTPLAGPNGESRFPVIDNAPRTLGRVRVGDVNSDGFDDVLAADTHASQAVVAEGHADGLFGPVTGPDLSKRVGSAFATAPGLTDVIAVDVNEDGKRDLVATAGAQILILYATTPVPGVRTGVAADVGHSSATVGAIVNPSGTNTVNNTTYLFQYGTTAAYGQTTAALPSGGHLAGDAYVPVSAVLDGLAPETTYHYRVVASNGHGTTYGRDRVFRTGATPPPPDGGQHQPPVTPLDRTAPQVTLSLARTLKRAKFLKRGVRVTGNPNEASTLEFELLGSTRRIRLARVGDVVLAARRLPLAAGRRSVTLKLPRKFRRGLSRHFTLTIRVTATDGAGNRTVTARRLKVR